MNNSRLARPRGSGIFTQAGKDDREHAVRAA